MPKKEIVGLIPAAGTAERISPLPCSKELLPVGFHQTETNGDIRPKVVSHYLLESMHLAGISKAYMILRRGKWDIPAYFGDGKIVNLSIAYLMMDLPFGVPYTLDQAYPFIKDDTILFGFPDIIFQPRDAFIKLLAKLEKTNADIVLGLFASTHPHNEDMVDFKNDGTIRGIEIRPESTNLQYTWIISVWTPSFTRFMHNYIKELKSSLLNPKKDDSGKKPQELFLGNIFHAAIRHHMPVEMVLFNKNSYIDIGTPDNLIKVSQNLFEK